MTTRASTLGMRDQTILQGGATLRATGRAHAETFDQFGLVEFLALREFAGHDAVRQTACGDIGQGALFGSMGQHRLTPIVDNIQKC